MLPLSFHFLPPPLIGGIISPQGHTQCLVYVPERRHPHTRSVSHSLPTTHIAFLCTWIDPSLRTSPATHLIAVFRVVRAVGYLWSLDKGVLLLSHLCFLLLSACTRIIFLPYDLLLPSHWSTLFFLALSFFAFFPQPIDVCGLEYPILFIIYIAPVTNLAELRADPEGELTSCNCTPCEHSGSSATHTPAPDLDLLSVHPRDERIDFTGNTRT